MQRAPSKALLLRVTLVFLLSYVGSLAGWLLVKDYYGAVVVSTASRLVASLKEVRQSGRQAQGDRQVVSFLVQGVKGTIKIDIGVRTSSFTFNAPLTFAVMAAFWPFVKRRRVYLETAGILVGVHLLYVFASEGHTLTATLARTGFRAPALPTVVFWEFLWGFVDNLVIRFEPFLVGVYLYFRK